MLVKNGSPLRGHQDMSTFSVYEMLSHKSRDFWTILRLFRGSGPRTVYWAWIWASASPGRLRLPVFRSGESSPSGSSPGERPKKSIAQLL